MYFRANTGERYVTGDDRSRLHGRRRRVCVLRRKKHGKKYPGSFKKFVIDTVYDHRWQSIVRNIFFHKKKHTHTQKYRRYTSERHVKYYKLN